MLTIAIWIGSNKWHIPEEDRQTVQWYAYIRQGALDMQAGKPEI